MPRHPRLSHAAQGLPATTYSIAPRTATEGETFPLHLGDTWRLPPAGCRLEDLAAAGNADLYRYAPPGGLPALVDALIEQERAAGGTSLRRKNLLVAAGATGAFAAVLAAIVEPGDEVLLLAPHWPLVAGLVGAFGGLPVDVPFHRAAGGGDGGVPDSPQAAVAAVAARRTERTVALYFNSPNNPTGEVLPRSWIEALVAWCRSEGLWVLADDAYRDFVYAPGAEAVDARALAPERTFAFRTFSKSFGMAGNRCGWVVGPLPAMGDALKLATQLVYSAPTGAQLSALAALAGPGEAWTAAARRQYGETGARAAERLGIPAPRGGTFLFLDVADSLGDGDLTAFLQRAAARGLLLSPGTSFGPYPTSIRLCFSAVPPAVVERGVEVLRELLGR